MKYYIFSMLLTASVCIYSQDKGIFVEHKDGFLEEIFKSSDDFIKSNRPLKKTFRIDFTGMDIPKSINEFTSCWFNPPVSQGRTGTCWCFSTTSFFESECLRLTGKKVKLSEMYTVYWEYIEKTKRYINERGESEFSEGSEANAVTRIWKEYGIVPEDFYTGLRKDQKFHDHAKMIEEMQSYLKNIKTNNAWNEDDAVRNIKSILNHYLGEPPTEVIVDGKKYTPKTYLNDYLKIITDDYVDVMSLMEKPYFKKVEYEVSDNWWHNSDYYNIPLDDFMSSIKNAIKNGYTLAIGGDVSEAGYDTWKNAAVVPSFDIPSKSIDENARQFRFSNGTTQDDHGIHLVGYENKNGRSWFLIKDSGAGSRNGNSKGYVFYDEDYVKLKIMDFMVHKDAVKELLSKFN